MHVSGPLDGLAHEPQRHGVQPVRVVYFGHSGGSETRAERAHPESGGYNILHYLKAGLRAVAGDGRPLPAATPGQAFSGIHSNPAPSGRVNMRRAIDVTILHRQPALQQGRGHQPPDLEFLKPGLLYGDHVHLFTPNNTAIELLGGPPDWEHYPVERKLAIARETAKGLAESEQLNAMWPPSDEAVPFTLLPDMLKNWSDATEERYARYLRTRKLTARDPQQLKDFDLILKTIIDAMLGSFRDDRPDAYPIIRLMQAGLVSLYPLDYAEDLTDIARIEFSFADQRFSDDERMQSFLALFAKRMWKIWDTPDAFPLLDETLGSWAEMLSSKHPAAHGRGSGRQKELPLAGEFFGQLPGFQRATVDELLDIRRELHDSLQRFRLALAGISEELTDTRNSDEFRGEARSLWTTEVLPVIQEIDDSVRANKYLYQLTEHMLTKPDGLIAAGGVVVGAMAAHDVPRLAAAAAAAALPAARALWDSWKNNVKIRHNKFYFIYALNRRLS